MLLVKTEVCFFWMVLCYTSFASMGNKHCHESCNTSTLQAPLGSVVLLSCSFGSTSLGISPGHGWVVWNQGSGSGASLVNITSSGKVDFLDPRQGRVKAFPNQGGLGNFSILIDALQASDLGSYCCELQSHDQCHRVEVEELEEGSHIVLFFSVGSLAILLVLLSGCFCWVKWTRVSTERTPDYINTHICAGSSAPPEDVACSDNVGRDVVQERGVGNERPIYENNEHDPTRMQHDPTRIHHDPTTIQHDPTTIQYDPTRIQHDPTAIQHDPTTIQHDLSRFQHDPTTIQHDLSRFQHDPTTIQHDPTRIQHDPTRIQHEAQRNQHEPVRYKNKLRDSSENRRQGFHGELMSRLRQSSLGQRYYANQAEINQQTRVQMDNHQRANEAKTNQDGRSQMDNCQRGSFWRKKPKERKLLFFFTHTTYCIIIIIYIKTSLSQNVNMKTQSITV
ncbi:uncharacterized protein LOC110507737 isoform X2 [Oncorhynchus mykiss]|uniref:uncharacterized protein LOC110507737 isoform X2 n=1 Tax=Oncorhynchus mykiss TaxID=8022 RepID=UPI0018787BC1|nr:uncharacterized protein LOC110507737 isoform X2 [Oncorhynchus mykiss]